VPSKCLQKGDKWDKIPRIPSQQPSRSQAHSHEANMASNNPPEISTRVSTVPTYHAPVAVPRDVFVFVCRMPAAGATPRNNGVPAPAAGLLSHLDHGECAGSEDRCTALSELS